MFLVWLWCQGPLSWGFGVACCFVDVLLLLLLFGSNELIEEGNSVVLPVVYLFICLFLRNCERKKGEDEALLFFSFGFKNGEVSQGTGNNFCSLFRFVRITF